MARQHDDHAVVAGAGGRSRRSAQLARRRACRRHILCGAACLALLRQRLLLYLPQLLLLCLLLRRLLPQLLLCRLAGRVCAATGVSVGAARHLLPQCRMLLRGDAALPRLHPRRIPAGGGAAVPRSRTRHRFRARGCKQCLCAGAVHRKQSDVAAVAAVQRGSRARCRRRQLQLRAVWTGLRAVAPHPG